ncbi:phosphoesterase [Globomyces pollinis-pini]|nr:phosphoesterase [Globomyces pollinis-pini]
MRFNISENRSFDHVLGALSMDGRMQLNGLKGDEFNYLTNGTKVKVRPVTKPSYFDPGHGLQQIGYQLYGVVSTWDYNKQVAGFEESLDSTFSYHTAKTMPVLQTLATDYAVIDDWYASFPGNTIPNRKFFYTANPRGSISQSGQTSAKSIFVNMEEQSKSWSHYYDGNGEWTYSRYLQDVGCVPGFNNCPVKRPYGLKKLNQFYSDTAAGKLPQLTSIDSDGSWDMHPGKNYGGGSQQGTVEKGQEVVKKIYNALRDSPQWNEIMFLITFDEHGGYYDHQAPPNYAVPAPDNSEVRDDKGPIGGDFRFQKLGVRVPTILISPWVPKGQTFRSGVNGRNFEHSSLSATLNKLFKLPSLSARDKWAMSFHDVFNYVSSPRTDRTSF